MSHGVYGISHCLGVGCLRLQDIADRGHASLQAGLRDAQTLLGRACIFACCIQAGRSGQCCFIILGRLEQRSLQRVVQVVARGQQQLFGAVGSCRARAKVVQHPTQGQGLALKSGIRMTVELRLSRHRRGGMVVVELKCRIELGPVSGVRLIQLSGLHLDSGPGLAGFGITTKGVAQG
jgi:hypothetical protein